MNDLAHVLITRLHKRDGHIRLHRWRLETNELSDQRADVRRPFMLNAKIQLSASRTDTRRNSRVASTLERESREARAKPDPREGESQHVRIRRVVIVLEVSRENIHFQERWQSFRANGKAQWRTKWNVIFR